MQRWIKCLLAMSLFVPITVTATSDTNRGVIWNQTSFKLYYYMFQVNYDSSTGKISPSNPSTDTPCYSGSVQSQGYFDWNAGSSSYGCEYDIDAIALCVSDSPASCSGTLGYTVVNHAFDNAILSGSITNPTTDNSIASIGMTGAITYGNTVFGYTPF